MHVTYLSTDELKMRLDLLLCVGIKRPPDSNFWHENKYEKKCIGFIWHNELQGVASSSWANFVQIILTTKASSNFSCGRVLHCLHKDWPDRPFYFKNMSIFIKAKMGGLVISCLLGRSFGQLCCVLHSFLSAISNAFYRRLVSLDKKESTTKFNSIQANLINGNWIDLFRVWIDYASYATKLVTKI